MPGKTAGRQAEIAQIQKGVWETAHWVLGGLAYPAPGFSPLALISPPIYITWMGSSFFRVVTAVTPAGIRGLARRM